MASESAHVALANRNQATINYLCRELNRHSAWVATIAFYKALHVVEAVFSNDPRITHTSDHESRFATLKSNRKYQNIYRHYSVLSRVSLVARYLGGVDRQGRGVQLFDDYMKPDVVASKVLFHHLKQVENSARQLINAASDLSSVETAREIIRVA